MIRVGILLGLIACEGAPHDDAVVDGGANVPAVSATTFTSQEAARALLGQATADRETDASARAAVARRHLGENVPIRTLAGTFVLVGADPAAPFQAAADEAQKALDIELGSFFQRHPDRAVTVYILGSWAPYDAICAQLSPTACGADDRGVLGSYDRTTRTIVANLGPGIPTLLHELIHPLIQSDFAFAPMWLDEGIASLFEKPVFFPPGEIHGANNWRHARLLRALASRDERAETRLSVLFGMHDESFQQVNEDLHYSLARSVCLWLDGRGQLWPFYRAWRDGYAEDSDGIKAFTQVVGRTPQEADGVWLAWVKTLR